MTTPTPEAGISRDHGCQTDGCPNDFSVITIRVDDSMTFMLCEGCHLAWSLKVLQSLEEQGLISAGQPEPASSGAAHQ